jgi:catechol 2,3-dioxygenase-like lactoylglutathione lyase family enzyme
VTLTGIDHVQLAAPPGSEDEARRFFGELLGLAEIEKPAGLRSRGGVWFAVGDRQLHIGIEPEFSPARKAHPALLAARGTLLELAERLVNHGSEVTWDHEIPDTPRLYVSDPWGNRIEIVESSQP